MTNQFQLFPFGFSDFNYKKLESQLYNLKLGIKLVKKINTQKPDDTDAIILDADDVNYTENLNHCHTLFPNHPIISYCSPSLEEPNSVILKKPLNRSNLLSIIDHLANIKLSGKQKTNEIAAIYSNHDSQQHYSIKNSFQDYLVKAWRIQKKAKQPVELVFLKKPVLLIDDNKAHTFISYDKLQHLCELTIHEYSITTSLLATPRLGLNSESSIDFIAKVIMWSSRGRLPYGVHSTDLVRLSKPEQQHNLPKIKGTHLIQTLWSEGGSSLQETEQLLHVQQSLLFSYFSALHAMDLVKVLPTDPPSAKKIKKDNYRSKWKWIERRIFTSKKINPRLLIN